MPAPARLPPALRASIAGALVGVALGALPALGACDGGRRPLCGPDETCPGASVEACAHGPEARLYGRSTFAFGTCAATDDAACRASAVTCPIWGQCSAPAINASAGACPEAEPEHERDHLASLDVGCGAGHTCVASKDADCRRALVCRTQGLCSARNGVCVASSAADCAASDLCADLGWCSLVGSRCTAARSADCEKSKGCDHWGECGVAPGGGCTSCERSQDCSVEGRCERVLTSDRCRATRPEHCRAASVCKNGGRCRPAQGECVQ
ncbi:MAG: hypothetical protein U1F43_14115 [Myxococcota bacterium]